MSKKHTFLMLACCLVGMGAVVAVLAFNVPVNRVLFAGMLLFCPLSHLFMMRAMLKHDPAHACSPVEAGKPEADRAASGEG